MEQGGKMSTNSQVEERFVEQEMTLLEQRVALEKRITRNLLMLLLCDIEKLPAIVLLELQRDLEAWSG